MSGRLAFAYVIQTQDPKPMIQTKDHKPKIQTQIEARNRRSKAVIGHSPMISIHCVDFGNFLYGVQIFRFRYLQAVLF